MQKINRMKIVQFNFNRISCEHICMIFAWEVILQNFHVKRKSCELLFLVIYMYYNSKYGCRYWLQCARLMKALLTKKGINTCILEWVGSWSVGVFLFIPSMCRQWTKFLRTLPFQAPHLSSSMSPIFRTLGNPVSSWILTALTTPFYS